MRKIIVSLAAAIVLLSCSIVYAEAPMETKKVVLHFFWGDGCPHCAAEKEFLKGLKKKYPALEIKDYEVWKNRENAARFAEVAKAVGIQSPAVPATFVEKEAMVGFSAEVARIIEKKVAYCSTNDCDDPMSRLDEVLRHEETSIEIPFIGKIDTSGMSLPVFTLIIAGLDSFNPCAFFVLFFLLSLLIHARSRAKMLLIGLTFVFFSGLIYFLFMAAWLNLFLYIGELKAITAAAGAIAIVVAAINVKDFFIFKKGVSLTISDSAKEKLFSRMRGLLKATSVPSMMAGTVVLAVAANTYELLCTAGFPMVYTAVLKNHSLPISSYYLYMAAYNAVYVIPLALIVTAFAVTLGSRKLSEWEGRRLKLLSGVMMSGLGAVLLLRPQLLNNVFLAAGLLAGAIAVTAAIIYATKRLRPDLAE